MTLLPRRIPQPYIKPRGLQPPLTITTMSTSSSKRDWPQSQTHTPSSFSSSLPLPKFLTHPLPTLHQKFRSINEHEAFLRQAAAAAAAGREEENTWPAQSHTRNRYADIFPWAHNAVQLLSLEDPYINASPISLGRRGEWFIATQGPLGEDGGEGLFWEMVWQEGCEVVVMLTQVWEDGREKCSVYYPVAEGEVKDVPGWGRVECVRVREEERTEVRELKVWKGGDAEEKEEGENRDGEGGGRGEGGEDGEKRESENEEGRTVYHFLFLGWPDHDIPVSPRDRNALLELIRLSRFRMQSPSEEEENEVDGVAASPPRLVHCSAGVGRTGTFIALDHLLHELKDGKFDSLRDEYDEDDYDHDDVGTTYSEEWDVDPVYDTVKTLREQRMFMVGKPKQYAFIYHMLRETWEAREKDEQNPSLECLNTEEESQTNKRRLAQDGLEHELDMDGKRNPDLK
jgi:protein-tyrosine phosphatase